MLWAINYHHYSIDTGGPHIDPDAVDGQSRASIEQMLQARVQDVIGRQAAKAGQCKLWQ